MTDIGSGVKRSKSRSRSRSASTAGAATGRSRSRSREKVSREEELKKAASICKQALCDAIDGIHTGVEELIIAIDRATSANDLDPRLVREQSILDDLNAEASKLTLALASARAEETRLSKLHKLKMHVACTAGNRVERIHRDQGVLALEIAANILKAAQRARAGYRIVFMNLHSARAEDPALENLEELRCVIKNDATGQLVDRAISAIKDAIRWDHIEVRMKATKIPDTSKYDGWRMDLQKEYPLEAYVEGKWMQLWQTGDVLEADRGPFTVVSDYELMSTKEIWDGIDSFLGDSYEPRVPTGGRVDAGYYALDAFLLLTRR